MSIDTSQASIHTSYWTLFPQDLARWSVAAGSVTASLAVLPQVALGAHVTAAAHAALHQPRTALPTLTGHYSALITSNKVAACSGVRWSCGPSLSVESRIPMIV